MRLDRAIWAAWLVTLLGGLAVVAGTLTVVLGPCNDGGPCPRSTIEVATWVAVAGVVLAATGVLAGTALTIAHWRRR